MNPSQAPPSSSPGAPTEASPERQILHTIIAVAGWILFCWWWWLVLGHVSRETVRLTLLFISLALAFIVTITLIWTAHNVLIYRRRGPRTHVPRPVEDWRRDRLGKSIAFKPGLEAVRAGRIVVLRSEHEGKVYRTAAGFPAGTTTGLATTVAWRDGHDAR